ncbi:MAG: hypothetical protein HQK50_14290 [Oligoflexia bacterium]|nr:hypothetical protein [Oligoflexia bacterium]MBF0366739.1 hypothetical protein [Oligoflexia bacterium]
MGEMQTGSGPRAENYFHNNVIFFLKLGVEVAEGFRREFSKLGVYVLFVEVRDVVEAMQLGRNMNNLVVVVTSMKEKLAVDSLMQKHLLKQVQQRRLMLFYISSFMDHVQVNFSKRSFDSYYVYHLPQSFGYLASEIAYRYFSVKEGEKRWPGGKRARLLNM